MHSNEFNPKVRLQILITILPYVCPTLKMYFATKEIPFTQEMQATAEIITDDLRLIQRLFYQLNEMIDR